MKLTLIKFEKPVQATYWAEFGEHIQELLRQGGDITGKASDQFLRITIPADYVLVSTVRLPSDEWGGEKHPSEYETRIFRAEPRGETSSRILGAPIFDLGEPEHCQPTMREGLMEHNGLVKSILEGFEDHDPTVLYSKVMYKDFRVPFERRYKSKSTETQRVA